MKRFIFVAMSLFVLLVLVATTSVVYSIKAATAIPATAPPTEVIHRSGYVQVPDEIHTMISWPTFPDGTPGTSATCSGIASPGFPRAVQAFSVRVASAGLQVYQNHVTDDSNYIYYMMVCSRPADVTVAVNEATWGHIKTLYHDGDQ
jgi:hypothetical protein